jgi:ABC-type uncharacterized transport system permease subunit
MPWQYAVSTIGTIGLILAAVFAAINLFRPTSKAGRNSVVVVLAVLLINLGTVVFGVAKEGVVGSLRQSFDSSILLVSLVIVVGIIGRSAAGMRGLDAVLFLAGAVIQFGSLFQVGQPEMNVAYKSWFVSHQVAFVISGACFVAAGGAGAVYLIITELLRRKHGLTLLGRLAPLESLERFGRWMLVIGFPALTYGVLTGFCQLSRQKNPGPIEWLKDPIVIFTLVLWAVYAVGMLALWFQPRMRGRRGATLATMGLVLVVVVFVAMEHISTLHR